MISPLASHVVPPRLREVVLAEREIGTRLDQLAGQPTGDSEADELLSDLARMSRVREEKARHRLREICGEAPDSLPGRRPQGPGRTPGAVAALGEAFGFMSRMMIAYTALAPATNRVRDSAITAHEGLTGHLARDGTQECLLAMGRIAGIIHAAAIRELESEGIDCQCTCPCCGLGLCVCGNGTRVALSEAWMAARPHFAADETPIPRPRRTSGAAAADLKEGDAIVAVDGTAITSYPQLQTAIKAHEPGSAIEFDVLRDGRRQRIIAVRTIDLGDGDLPLDCEAPSGEGFYLDRARDLQQKLRRRAETGAGSANLASLSTRETQVLRLLVDGATNPMIAAKLHIQRPTVARHVQNILAKLNVTNRAEAAAIGAEHGLRSDL